MNIEPQLLKAYKNSYFFVDREIAYSEYAIITAWNPFSHPVSNRDNQFANRQLKHEIVKQNYEIIQVGDINREWTEESYVVQIPLCKAVQLGKKYHQNAIYYVENNELFLVSCIEENEWIKEKIGLFSVRVIDAGLTPKELK